jgi:membrane-associated protein
VTTLVATIDPLRSAGPLMVWAIVLGFMFAECAFIVGVFLPGDSMLLAAGLVLAQHDREFDVWALSACTIVVAVAGNHVGYAIGAKTGTRLLARKGGRVLTRRNVERAGRFFEHFGFWAVVLARWVPWLRTLAPMMAGAAGMDRRKFFLASLTGAVAWVPTLMLAGYYSVGLVDRVAWLHTALVVAVVALFVGATGFGLWRYRQEMRRPVDEAPELLPVGRRET